MTTIAQYLSEQDKKFEWFVGNKGGHKVLMFVFEDKLYSVGPFLAIDGLGISEWQARGYNPRYSKIDLLKSDGVRHNGIIERYTRKLDRAQMMGKFSLMAQLQGYPYPLPDGKIMVNYGEGHLSYANDECGYMLVWEEMLHVFSKKYNNYPKLWPLDYETYYLSAENAVMIPATVAVERIKGISVDVFSDPYAWVTDERTGARRTTVLNGMPVMPKQEEES
jgi:hypothetical protein